MLSRFVAIILLVLVLCERSSAQIVFATKSGKEIPIDLYNDIGLGYGFKSIMFSEQLNISLGTWVVGLHGAFGGRYLYGHVDISPYRSFDIYQFTKEFAFLIGRQFYNNSRNMIVLTAGPSYKVIRGRDWPTSGSVAPPLLGFMLDRFPALDQNLWGGRVNVALLHTNERNNAGIGLTGFASYTGKQFGYGATLNFLFGAVR